jgi:ABC-2 type transport system permease protein
VTFGFTVACFHGAGLDVLWDSLLGLTLLGMGIFGFGVRRFRRQFG